MTKSVLVLLTLCLAFTLLPASPALAARPTCGDNKCTGGENETCPADCEVGGGTEDIPVCVFFRDGLGDQVRSDNAGMYCDGSIDGVKAIIRGFNGGFTLDTTGTSPVRPVILNFPGCLAFPGITDVGGECSTEAHLISRNGYLPDDPIGGATGGKFNLLGMDDGETALVDFQINFPSELSNSTPNVIVFGGSSADPCGYPLTVTHSDSNTWKITTPLDGAIPPEACLWEVFKRNGKRAFILDEFDLPFEITITKQ